MKKAIQERAALQEEMLLNRHKQHETLQRSNAASTERLSQVLVKNITLFPFVLSLRIAVTLGTPRESTYCTAGRMCCQLHFVGKE